MRIDSEQQALAQCPPPPGEHQDPAPVESVAAGYPDRLAPLELESLLLNLEGALRVRARQPERKRIIKQLTSYLWKNKLWWLIPPVVLILTIGALIAFSSVVPIGPAIYVLL